MNWNMIVESTSAVAPRSAPVYRTTPFRGVFSLVGSRALVCRLENPGSHPSKILHQSGVFSLGDYIARTPHDSKSLTGRRGIKRYAVCRKARVQLPNNPQDWLNTQVWGLAFASMCNRVDRGEQSSYPNHSGWVGEAFRRTIPI